MKYFEKAYKKAQKNVEDLLEKLPGKAGELATNVRLLLTGIQETLAQPEAVQYIMSNDRIHRSLFYNILQTIQNIIEITDVSGFYKQRIADEYKENVTGLNPILFASLFRGFSGFMGEPSTVSQPYFPGFSSPPVQSQPIALPHANVTSSGLLLGNVWVHTGDEVLVRKVTGEEHKAILLSNQPDDFNNVRVSYVDPPSGYHINTPYFVSCKDLRPSKRQMPVLPQTCSTPQ